MKISSWGKYPEVDGSIQFCKTLQDYRRVMERQEIFIPRGNGRSYGDSGLQEVMLSTRSSARFLSWDESTGILECEAGVLLADILNQFSPKGWFLSTTPGTKWITVGGAIASDVHGKNHHSYGCFSKSVIDFLLLRPDSSLLQVSEQTEPDWFHATCGGMGLTGIILVVRLKLLKVQSAWFDQTTIKTRNLQETMEAFESSQSTSHSVAWIDCLAQGKGLGRCLLMTGSHSEKGSLDFPNKTLLKVPSLFPSWTLNSLSMKTFNALYYRKSVSKISQQHVHANSFFYPLDVISDWNRIYGKCGFLQYQFVLPLTAGFEGLQKILQEIAATGKGSFLAVLKLLGKNNQNWLSFPQEGYTLALDFKREAQLFPLLERLDAMVLDYGGRFYLTKDARMSKATFDRGYPQADRFREFRQQHHLHQSIQSLQSRRLEL